MLTDQYAQGCGPASADLQTLWDRMFTYDGLDEQVVMASMLKEAVLDPQQLKTTQALATQLAKGVRKARLDAGGVDLLTQEFTLDSREGVALMCLAEAMLRVPDTETRNKLIRDKIVDQDWKSHIGRSPSLFVNASAWGLALTGKVLKSSDTNALSAALSNVLRKGGEGIVRAGVSFAMRLLGKQFVTGQTIEEALSLAKGREKLGYRYSYDMLGEGALTSEDANDYYKAYAHTIEMIGRSAGGLGTIEGPGVSVKLTGLHPRYEVAQRERVLVEMYPKLLELARAAKRWDIGFHLDQEEASRFPLTLEMLHKLAHEPDLAGWEGLGISLQAYQKRCRAVTDWLIALGRATRRRILVRLVKGAYWDTEIKRCQAEGADGYPVFTRKVHSDVCYLACAKALLNAPDAIFPQFATHNAFSIAAVHTLGQGKAYEFQCLHGMGESVYDQVVGEHQLGRACRVYAPVGPHETLLAYLVRRLLENGANTSFVNQVVDPSITIEQMVENPIAKALRTGGQAHPAIPSPRALLAWRDGAPAATIHANHASAMAPNDLVPPGFGRAHVASVMDIVSGALSSWGGQPWSARVAVLHAVAQQLEQGCPAVEATLLSESGLTLAEAGEELRHAADLCRFYAAQAQADGALAKAAPRGVAVLLAPQTSPLAWSTGQIAAALVTGNGVALRPPLAMPRTALAIAHLFQECGVPAQALQVVQGDDEAIAAELVSHPATSMVVVGGPRSVVRQVSKWVAEAPDAPVLLAHSATCNVMVVDSSALPEAVITDAVTGAFDGAGLRSGALKVLGVQEDVAEKVMGMMLSMLKERQIGLPLDGASDIGPLTGAGAAQAFERKLDAMAQKGFQVIRAGRMQSNPGKGEFVQPAIVDLGSYERLQALELDTAGPVLYVVRWQAGQLDALLHVVRERVAPAMLGLHTRIFETAGEVVSVMPTTGICVNRGVHTLRLGMQVSPASVADVGPSPTGPFYLREWVRGAHGDLVRNGGPLSQERNATSPAFLEYPALVGGRLQDRRVVDERARTQRAELLKRLAALAPMGASAATAKQRLALVTQLACQLGDMTLPALSGEENTLQLVSRGPALCMGPSTQGLYTQVLYAIACGCPVLLPISAENEGYLKVLGQQWCQLVNVDASLFDQASAPCSVIAESVELAVPVQRALTAARHPVAVLTADGIGEYPWWRLLAERQVTINVSASGGNTQLMATGAEAA